MTGYPVILNGDHAEFEQEHANTPPKERPDWPLPSFDARDWAEAFCKIAKSHGHDIDQEWMVTWFANALMRGFDEHAGRLSASPAIAAIYWGDGRWRVECAMIPDLEISSVTLWSLLDKMRSRTTLAAERSIEGLPGRLMGDPYVR